MWRPQFPLQWFLGHETQGELTHSTNDIVYSNQHVWAPGNHTGSLGVKPGPTLEPRQLCWTAPGFQKKSFSLDKTYQIAGLTFRKELEQVCRLTEFQFCMRHDTVRSVLQSKGSLNHNIVRHPLPPEPSEERLWGKCKWQFFFVTLWHQEFKNTHTHTLVIGKVCVGGVCVWQQHQKLINQCVMQPGWS